jgi:hypothetical protein
MRAWLLTNQSQLAHQTPSFKAVNGNAFVTEKRLDCPAASRTSALGEQSVYLSF